MGRPMLLAARGEMFWGKKKRNRKPNMGRPMWRSDERDVRASRTKDSPHARNRGSRRNIRHSFRQEAQVQPITSFLLEEVRPASHMG